MEEISEIDSLPSIIRANDESNNRKYCPENKAGELKFSTLCTKLEKIESQMNRANKRKISKLSLMETILSPQLREHLAGESAYPLFRLLLPGLYDSQRPTYGMKETMFVKLYAHALGLPKGGVKEKILTHYTDSSFNRSYPGDLPSTIKDIAKDYAGTTHTDLTLDDVNSLLNDLANGPEIAGKSNRKPDEVRIDVIRRINSRISARDQKWLTRIIFKSMRLRFSREDMLSWLHPEATTVLSKTNDLRYVCSVFAKADSGLGLGVEIGLNTPFTPMLAFNPGSNFSSIVPMFKGAPFVMEVKLDGERMLCHKNGKDIRWLTRKGTDYTSKYGPVMSKFVLSQVKARQCILDGEMMSWDDDLKKMVGFGKNRSFARAEANQIESGFLNSISDGLEGVRQWLCFVIFDIIYLNGDEDIHLKSQARYQTPLESTFDANRIIQEARDQSAYEMKDNEVYMNVLNTAELKLRDITKLPLDVRRRILKSTIMPAEHRFEILEGEVIKTGGEGASKALDEYFDRHVILRGEEGLIVKNLSSTYLLGEKGRSAHQWLKMKPDYSNQTQPLDLVVIGGYYGSGGNGGFVSSFLMACRGDGDALRSTQMYPCGKVGTGLNAQELKDINRELQDKWVTAKRGCLPEFLVPEDDDIFIPLNVWPDVFICPQDSAVLEVKCAEFTPNDSFKAGFTMRFPRVEKIRRDKGWQDCDNLTAVTSARSMPRKSKTTQSGPKAKKRPARSLTKPIVYTSQFDALMEVERVGSSFVTPNGAKLEICLFSDVYNVPEADDHKLFLNIYEETKRQKLTTKRYSRDELQHMILERGGTVVPNPTPTTTYVIVNLWDADGLDACDVSTSALIKSCSFTVLAVNWLLNAVQCESPLPPEPNHIYSTDPTTREIILQAQDNYGDSYTEDTTSTSLEQVFLKMRKLEPTSKDFNWRKVAENMIISNQDELHDGEILDPFRSRFTSMWQRAYIYVDIYRDFGAELAGSTRGGEISNISSMSPHVLPYSPLISIALAIQLYAGNLAPCFSEDVTHVILDPQNADRLSALHDRRRKLHARSSVKAGLYPHKLFLNSSWVEACAESGCIIEPKLEHMVLLRNPPQDQL